LFGIYLCINSVGERRKKDLEGEGKREKIYIQCLPDAAPQVLLPATVKLRTGRPKQALKTTYWVRK
jgi:hypothetical protein